MKKLLLAAAAAAGMLSALPAAAQVTVTVGDPDFFGVIQIGDYPQPRLIYAEPVIIETVRVRPAPVYLRVPPGHAKDWRKHCAKYGACAQPVYFVDDVWYRDVYVPAYRQRVHVKSHGGDHNGKGHSGKHNGKHKGGKGKGKKD